MRKRCATCGERLFRVHRTWKERFQYMAVFECSRCHTLEASPRAWALHLGDAARCPRCGTLRLTRLREPDKIDKHHRGFLNLLERAAGGRLIHCRYCRIQFWDRRPLSTELPADEVAVTNPPDTASSGG